MKSGFYVTRRWPAQWLDLEDSIKHSPKPNLHQKKVKVTFWCFAAGLILYSFLNPGKTITYEKHTQQSDEMHWKTAMLQPVLVNWKGPILLHDNTRPHVTQPALQKLNNLGGEVLPYLPYLPDRSSTDLPLLQASRLFAGKMLPWPVGCWKCFPRVCWISKHGILHHRKKTNLFLIGKSVLIVIVPILINKGVLEPSYSDLKSTVQSCSYIFTNLHSPSSLCLLYNKPIIVRDGVLKQVMWLYSESLLTKKMAD